MKKPTAKLETAIALDKHCIDATFSDGRTVRVDLSAVIAQLASFAPLADDAAFATVAVADFGWTLEWPCGASLDSDRLLEMALEQSGQSDAVRFRRWQDQHGLSLSAAADSLGMTRRTISQYRTGARPIPKTVLLACKGWEVEQAEAAKGA